MTYTLVWSLNAVNGLVRLREVDPAAAKEIRIAVAALAEDPYPASSSELGSPTVRRLRLGPARVLYEVNVDLVGITVLTVGRTHIT